MARRRTAVHHETVPDEPIDQKNRFGGGCYGEVYLVKYKGAPCIAKRLLDVLMGTGGQEPTAETGWRAILEKFQNECVLLSRMHHPNVVQFIGTYNPTSDPRDLVLVMEKMYMDLEQFITKFPKAPLPIKLHILKDISCGLWYMHSLKIVHRDLNAGNVLLNGHLQAKVADFGASRIIDINATVEKLSRIPGALGYMPPEALRPNPQYDDKLDVFSFGHLAIYVINGIYPQLYEPTMEEILLDKGRENGILMETSSLQVQKRRVWLDKMADCFMYEEIVECLHDNPQTRPTMAKISEKLNGYCEINPKTQFLLTCLLDSSTMHELEKLNEDLKQAKEEINQVEDQVRIFTVLHYNTSIIVEFT